MTTPLVSAATSVTLLQAVGPLVRGNRVHVDRLSFRWTPQLDAMLQRLDQLGAGGSATFASLATNDFFESVCLVRVLADAGFVRLDIQ